MTAAVANEASGCTGSFSCIVAAGKAPGTGLPPQAAAAPQQRKNCSADLPSSSTAAAAQTCPKKRPSAEPPAFPFSLPRHQPPRKRAHTSALDTADTAPVKQAKPSAANSHTPGSPFWLQKPAADAKCQAGANAGVTGNASGPAALLQTPNPRTAANLAASNQIPAAPSQTPNPRTAANLAASNQIPAAPSQTPLRAAANPSASNQILAPGKAAAGASKAAAAEPESRARQQPQLQMLPQPPRRSVGAATKSRFAAAAGGGTGPLAGIAQGPIAAPLDNSAVLTEDYKGAILPGSLPGALLSVCCCLSFGNMKGKLSSPTIAWSELMRTQLLVTI